MPIKGLTDTGASFPRIGELRKGEEKPENSNRPGKDLDRFRFTSKHNPVMETFSLYYPTGNNINVFLPFQTTNDNFEAWQEQWVAGGLVHRCDGETAVIWRTPDGKYSHDPVPCPGGCSQVGRLKVIIPELARLAYVVALTTSKWDITEIHANLTAYQALRGDLRGIPFILSRVPRMISTPAPDGKRVRREKWLIHIEAAPDWVNAQLISMKQAALPTIDDGLYLESGIDEFNQDIYPDEYSQSITIDAEIVEDEETAVLNNKTADLRAALETADKVTLGTIANYAKDAGLFGTPQLALKAIGEYEFPDGVKIEMKQIISNAGALKVWDWLTKRVTT